MLKGYSGNGEEAAGSRPRQPQANEGLGKRPSDSSRRPSKQIKGFTEPMQGARGSAEAYASGAHDDEQQQEHGETGLQAAHADRLTGEEEDHATANENDGGQEGGTGQQDLPDQAANPELTDVIAAGIIAMSSRRSVLLEKIDVLTEAGVQCIDQLKENFRAEMARLRGQLQEGTEAQEQSWRLVSNETRAAEERLRCARALVECLNAQGLGAM